MIFLLEKNNDCAFFPRFIWYPEGPETSKTWKKGVLWLPELNATNRDFVRKSHKSSKI
jgi:hypothetical protein